VATISIIVPVFNEEKGLSSFINHLEKLSPKPTEVIVVDGGSTDHTLNILNDYPEIKVFHSPVKRRAYQLHLGAVNAVGEVLCFLHADTFLIPDALKVVEAVLSNRKVALAGFTSVMIGEKGIQQITTFHNFIKTYYAAFLFRPIKFLINGGRLLFGDQAMFCRRSIYFECGGFDPEMPIMEEADLCDRICAHGSIKQLPFPVYSSDRRVKKWGVFKANMLYLYIGLLWGLGYSPYKLHQVFKDIR
jgi:rSAM/selenodomain-associated transferase 2